jgi:MinD superfamily P-loop ATPase
VLREIVIISGKGGTGKTCLTAAFAHLAVQPVICDLDVDAPDLHLLLQPQNITTQEFISGHTAVITSHCDSCGKCIDGCHFDAIRPQRPHPTVNPLKCEGCKLCVALCPIDAIDFPEKQCGRWHLADTRFGPMIHAQLFPGEENSGRLVTLLKNKARTLAQEQQIDLILADGPPGIGCPVISSLAGANLAVVVTEPTPSGIHDLKRVVDLCDHFRLSAGVVINKWDLNADLSRQIKAFCSERKISILGQLPHDPAIVEAMVRGQTITEYTSNGTVELIREIWTAITALIGMPRNHEPQNIMQTNSPIENNSERSNPV